MTIQEQEERDLLFEQLPPLPEDWQQWLKTNFSPTPIFYRKESKTIYSCTCGKCAEEYIIDLQPEDMYELAGEKPVRKEYAQCPVCGMEGRYEWKRKKGSYEEYMHVILYQTLPNGMLCGRIFWVQDRVHQGHEEKLTATEDTRIFFIQGGYKQYTYKSHYITRDRRSWVTDWTKSKGFGGHKVDFLREYPGLEEILPESNMKYSGALGCLETFSTVERLKAYSNNPFIEYYEKMGLDRLVNHLVSNDGIDKRINRRAQTIYKQLRIRKKEMKILQEHEGSLEVLELLQAVKKDKENKATVEQLLWIIKSGVHRRKRVFKVAGYSSLTKLINYLDKQTDGNGYTQLGEYIDYIDLREELGYDMSRSTYIFPKDLHAKHQEMVEEHTKRKDELYITQMMEKYSNILKNFEKENKKLYREHDGLTIRPARSAEEIIMEGRLQHHCVGGENYLKKHNERTTQILLLRTKPNKPYYTVEIGKDLQIIQFYAAHDKQPDKEKIKAWLEWYVSDLKKHKVKI